MTKTPVCWVTGLDSRTNGAKRVTVWALAGKIPSVPNKASGKKPTLVERGPAVGAAVIVTTLAILAGELCFRVLIDDPRLALEYLRVITWPVVVLLIIGWLRQ